MVVVLLLLAGIYLDIKQLVATIVIFLALAGVSWLWSWYSLKKVSCRLTLGKSRAFPGDKLELTFEVGNNKNLFLSWLETEIELPHRLVTGKLKTASPYIRERFRWTTSVSGRQHLIWKDSLECRARGDYELGPIRLRSGDIFGFFLREKLVPASGKLLVYPRIVPVDKLNLPMRQLTGETVASRNVYEDISRTMGTRAYQREDPFKRIHWKASAHSGQLQARQYESTTSPNLLLMFEIDGFCHRLTGNEELFELAVTTVASLADEACRQEFSVGLVANSVPEVDIPFGTGLSQLLILLEALARVEAKSRLSIQQQFERQRSSLPPGAMLVLVAADLSSSLMGLVHTLRREGQSIAVVNLGQNVPVGNLGDVPVLSVYGVDEISQNHRTVKL